MLVLVGSIGNVILEECEGLAGDKVLNLKSVHSICPGKEKGLTGIRISP
jgi:hypothetical protein